MIKKNMTLASIVNIDSESEEDENSCFDKLNNLPIAYISMAI
jgi:hypothetical protein